MNEMKPADQRASHKKQASQKLNPRLANSPTARRQQAKDSESKTLNLPQLFIVAHHTNLGKEGDRHPKKSATVRPAPIMKKMRTAPYNHATHQAP
jgi:hypothetical protein